MLQSYFPIYQIAIDLEKLRRTAAIYKGGYSREVDKSDAKDFLSLLKAMQRDCLALGLIPPMEMAKRLFDKGSPESYAVMFADLDHLDGSLITALEKDAVFRIPPERKDYFERDDLWAGGECRFSVLRPGHSEAGSCYAFGQEDACVHHLMLVLERGLNVSSEGRVPYQRINWQNIIDQIASKLKSAPKGKERDFYLEVNAQFGFRRMPTAITLSMPAMIIMICQKRRASLTMYAASCRGWRKVAYPNEARASAAIFPLCDASPLRGHMAKAAKPKTAAKPRIKKDQYGR